MSSRNSSVGYASGPGSSNHSTVSQDTFRSHKSKNHKGGLVERESASGHLMVINHHARGYDKDAPSPSYSHSSSYSRS